MYKRQGLRRAAAEDPALRAGVNIVAGKLTLRPVAEQFGLEYTPVEKALAA